MSDETPGDAPVEEEAEQNPPVDEVALETDTEETALEEVEEERDPLELALERAETAENEIAYKEAEIQNVRKRLMAEKAEAIQYGGMGVARRMLTILGDVDRAMTGIEDDDQSAVAQGLRLLRNKMWHELQADGVAAIEAKGSAFDPSKMEAIATIPATEEHASGKVVDVLEQGYMYKSKVIVVARVVVASD